ncbi:MAG: hypothetical protein ACLQPD_07965 [Desulfomonilaceae bacterium]
MTESKKRIRNETANEESQSVLVSSNPSTVKRKAQTTGTLRIRSVAEPLLIYGEGVQYVKVPINFSREARRKENLISNNWLDRFDTSK